MSDFVVDLTDTGAATPLAANAPPSFGARARAVLDFCAGQELPWDALSGQISGEDAVVSGIARLERGGRGRVWTAVPSTPQRKGHPPPKTRRYSLADNVLVVNDSLLRTAVQGDVGTDIADIPLDLLKRRGDWDVVLKGLIVMAYRHRRKLRREVYDHVLHVLLTQFGPRPAKADYVADLPIPETENHILMIESSRYLTNQLLYLEGWTDGQMSAAFDNTANGLEEWLLTHLQGFLRHDFREFNSKPYQRYSMAALQNLYDFAWDDRVRLAARVVLDYVSGKAAVSSNGLRRAVPFRRLLANVGETELMGGHVDAQTSRLLMLSGLIDKLAEVTPVWHAHQFSSDQMLLASLCTYRVPEMLLDIVMDKSHNSYYQQFSHGDHEGIPGGIEIYASQPAFLLSAGGVRLPSGNPSVVVFVPSPVPFVGISRTTIDGDLLTSYRDVANAVPTTVLATLQEVHRDRLLSLGTGDERYRNNTGVLPGFACGRDLTIPEQLLISEPIGGPIEPCVVTLDRWTFIDASGRCTHPQHRLGLYAAAYSQESWEPVPDGQGEFYPSTLGLLDVVPSDGRTFTDFYATILRDNEGSSLDLQVIAEYRTSEGHTVRFAADAHADTAYQWPIIAADGVAFDRNIHNWPLARGEIMSSDPRSAAAPAGRRAVDFSAPVPDGHAGVVTLDNPHYQQRLVLDMRDPMIPRRYQFRVNGPLNASASLATRDVFRLDACWVAPDGTIQSIAWDAYVNGGRWGYAFPLTHPGHGRRSSVAHAATPVAAVARTSEHVDVFWCQAGGALETVTWDANANSGAWTHPRTISRSPAGPPSKASGLAAVARSPEQTDVFWIGEDGSVWNAWATAEAGGAWQEHPAVLVSTAGTASPKSNLTAIARDRQRLEVFWVNHDGRVCSGSWQEAQHHGWTTEYISRPGAAMEDSAITANSRRPEHLDVFWIDRHGRIQNAWRSDTTAWHPPYPINPDGDPAALDSGLASTSRVPNQADVFWITHAGTVVSSFWNDSSATWIGPFDVTAAGAAALDSSVSAVARTPDRVDLLWTGPDGELTTHWWDGEDQLGNWQQHPPQVIAPAGSVAPRTLARDVVVMP